MTDDYSKHTHSVQRPLFRRGFEPVNPVPLKYRRAALGCQRTSALPQTVTTTPGKRNAPKCHWPTVWPMPVWDRLAADLPSAVQSSASPSRPSHFLLRSPNAPPVAMVTVRCRRSRSVNKSVRLLGTCAESRPISHRGRVAAPSNAANILSTYASTCSVP